MVSKYPKFKAGVYRHYKGPLYLTLGLAHDSNYEDRTAVIYIGLYLDDAKKGPRLAVRTYEDFYAWVDPKTGNPISKNDPKAVPRFKYVSQTYEGQQ